jgi:putative ABC transport system permease protein
VVGRLKPDVTFAQAQADLDTIASRLTAQYPRSNSGVGVTAMSLRDQVVGDVRRPLLILLGVVLFLLLMVCANIGNLLLARASVREREFALRAALGASRARLVRQILAESVLLASVGGGLGLALAAAGIGVLRWAAPAQLPRVNDLAINGVIAGFNFAVALIAGVLCGIIAAWPAGRGDLQGALKDGAHASSMLARLRARNVLVTVETALGVVVLVGAGLLLRSFVRLVQVPVGFRSDHVLTFRVVLPPARYRTQAQRTAFYEQLAERLQALPGVRSAAAISFLPLTQQGRTTGISVEGDAPAAVGQVRFVDFRSVSPGYFTSMSIPVVAGRDVAWTDTPAAPASIVISDTMARTFWPNQNALGKRIKRGRPQDEIPWLTVVGIVGDVRQLDLLTTPRPAMYFPPSQDQGTGDTLRDWIVKTSDDPSALAASLRSIVRSIDPALPLTRIQTMDAVRSAATASRRFNLLLVGLFASLALVLAAVGVYGVTAYAVAQRTREFGIRVALGAERRQVLGLVLTHGVRLVVAGVAVGTIVALALTGLMSSLLFEVGAQDPVTFAGVAVLLIVVSLVASFIPAHRATRVDPLIALRQA